MLKIKTILENIKSIPTQKVEIQENFKEGDKIPLTQNVVSQIPDKSWLPVAVGESMKFTGTERKKAWYDWFTNRFGKEGDLVVFNVNGVGEPRWNVEGNPKWEQLQKKTGDYIRDKGYTKD